jgi:hypothetical protein
MEVRMKKSVLSMFAWIALSVLSPGLAQVQPEAQTLIDKAVQAHGGRAAIEGIKTMTRLEVGRYQSSSDGKWYSQGYREIMDFAGRRYRSEEISSGFAYSARQDTVDGPKTWTPEDGIKSRASLLGALDRELLKALLAPLKSATLLGPRTVDGASGQAVTFTLQNNLGTLTYLFADDGAILARAYDTDFYPGAGNEQFGDFREVQGVRAYFWFRMFKENKLVQDFRAQEVRINEPLSADAFKLPPPAAPAGRIGIGLEAVAGVGIKVTEVEASSPAGKAGLQTGDVILEVDGVSMADWNDLRPNGIRGEPGTVVVLTIKRGDQTLKISVTREQR